MTDEEFAGLEPSEALFELTQISDSAEVQRLRALYVLTRGVSVDAKWATRPLDIARLAEAQARLGPRKQGETRARIKPTAATLVRTYRGTEETAAAFFRTDATRLSADGYFPTSQSFAPGSYGCGAFLVAIILCFVLIGFLIFIYMLIVKPAGTLTVTYERRQAASIADEKVCPRCAESVKAAAMVCRYCGFEFPAPSPD